MQREAASTPTDGRMIPPDYGSDSILGLAGGILDYFGVAPTHPALPIRRLFEESRNPKKTKIVLVILDAIGWQLSPLFDGPRLLRINRSFFKNEDQQHLPDDDHDRPNHIVHRLHTVRTRDVGVYPLLETVFFTGEYAGYQSYRNGP